LAEKKLTSKDVTPEFLLTQYKTVLLKRMSAGDNVASEIEKIARLEELLKTDPDKAKEELEKINEEPACGIPERNKVRRPYTLSPEALKARQLNAQNSTGPRTKKGKQKSAANGSNWKHGLYSKSIIRKTLGLCTEKCGKYPCPAVERKETKKGELCLDHEGLPLKIKTMVEAAKSGDIKEVKEISAALLAMATEMLERMMMNVHFDGETILEDMFDKNGAVIGQRLKNHPNLGPIIDAMAKLGITMSANRLTPQELQKTKDVEEDRSAFGKALTSAATALAKVHEKE
jgi:hypothetical protein